MRCSRAGRIGDQFPEKHISPFCAGLLHFHLPTNPGFSSCFEFPPRIFFSSKFSILFFILNSLEPSRKRRETAIPPHVVLFPPLLVLSSPHLNSPSRDSHPVFDHFERCLVRWLDKLHVFTKQRLVTRRTPVHSRKYFPPFFFLSNLYLLLLLF